MAVEIQEPNDLPAGSITPENENNYEVLVYQKAEDAAGIKRLGIGDWKGYLDFNSHKVNNVAAYVGMPDDYAWETDGDVPYTGTTVTRQIDTLATKLGISQEPGTFDPLYPRFQTVENEVNGTGSPATGGLMQRMTQAETDIQSIEEEIGSSGGGGSGSLTARVNALEGVVGDSSSGLVKDVADINTEIGDDTTANSIKGRIKTNETNIAANATNIGNLQTTVGDSTSGLVKDVTDLQATVGDSNSGLVKQVHDLESKVYQFRGSIVSATGDNPTTAITLSNGDIISVPSDLQNGNVFDIKPNLGETITINGVSYSKGNNIAWVVPEVGDAYFDELGMNIDVTRIDTLEQEVTTLNSYFQSITIDSSWTSENISDGIYQFSCVLGGSATGWNISTFILAFSNGGQSYTQTPIDISNNFSDYWEFDGVYHLKPKNITTNRKLSIHKIGEV